MTDLEQIVAAAKNDELKVDAGKRFLCDTLCNFAEKY